MIDVEHLSPRKLEALYDDAQFYQLDVLLKLFKKG